MARLVMANSAKVYSRDRQSIKVAQEILGESTERLAYSQDMGFALESANRKPDFPNGP
jgi:hypothetical protein